MAALNPSFIICPARSGRFNNAGILKLSPGFRKNRKQESIFDDK